MQVLSNILAFLFAAGVVIFVHEAGHYLVAKACGVKVLTFSLGFGSRIWGFRRGDTDYRLSVVPLGGYVAFAGQDPAQPSDDPGAFVNHPRWQRILILFAGPLMNVVLAILVVAGVYVAGTEIPDQRDVPTEIGWIGDGSPAQQAGLAVGDRIVALDGQAAADWQQVAMTLLTSPERAVTVRYLRGGEERETVLTPRRMPKYEFGDHGMWPAAPPRIAWVERGSPALRAGFRYGDALRAVDGLPIAAIDEFSAYVSARAGQTVRVEIERDSKPVTIAVVPRDVEGRGLIGVALREFHYKRLGPAAALAASARYNLDTARDIFGFVGKIFQRRISARSALGGPIEIAAISGAAARSGFRELLLFTALISLNLCILNLAPVPVLDGGQIGLLAVECVLRRDLSLGLKERMTQVGLVLIVLLMAFALYSDLVKNLPGLGAKPPSP